MRDPCGDAELYEIDGTILKKHGCDYPADHAEVEAGG